MRKEQTLSPVDGVALQKAFDRFVPKNFVDVQVGEIYGGQNDGEFCLIQKKSPRSVRALANECLCFKLDSDGRLRYWYRRTWDTVILTRVAPLLMLVGGVLIGGIIMKIPEMDVFGVLAACLFMCNLIRPKAQRADLLDKLMQILDLAEKQI